MKQERLNLYFIDMKYVRNLHKVDDRVQSISPQIHKSNRPFVGIIIICNEYKYCVPLDSAKEKHKMHKNDVDFTRIFDDEQLISVLNFNNMIPIDDKFTESLSVRVIECLSHTLIIGKDDVPLSNIPILSLQEWEAYLQSVEYRSTTS